MRSDRPTPLGTGSTLVLIPTELERRKLLAHGPLPLPQEQVQLAGFGPLAAAARCAQLLAELRPSRVLLIGIAGSFDTEQLPLGTAHLFHEVWMDDVGASAGPGRELRLPSQLGFPQWPSQADQAPVFEQLSLCVPDGQVSKSLLCVASASGSEQEAAARRRRFALVAAEEMEGFGVALACHMQNVPLAILRGISNRVGDPESENWDLEGALGAAHGLALAVLETPAWSPR